MITMVRRTHLNVVAVLALTGLTLACALSVCHAAALPTQPAASLAASEREQREATAPIASPSKTFLGADSLSRGGGGADPEVQVAPSAVDKPVGPARLLPPGPERALGGDDPVAGAADLAAGPTLDAAPARLSDGERVPADGGRSVAATQPALGVATVSVDVRKTKPEAVPDDSKINLLQAVIAALQAIQATTTTTTEGTIQGLDPPEDIPQPTTADIHDQVKPLKKPVFSDSYLPPLVQVLSHIVDVLEERELSAPPAPTSTTTTTPTPDVVIEVTDGTATSQPLAVEIVVATEVPSAASTPGETGIIIEGPAQDIVALLAQFNGGSHQPITLVDNGKDLPHSFVQEENGEDEVGDEAVSSAEDVKGKLAKDTIKIVVEDVTQGAENDAVKEVPEPVDDENEDMQEDMPVVQKDVPIVNEETVPMMMMMNMVPSDAPEMDSARTRRDTTADGGAVDAAYIPDEFKSFVNYPTTETKASSVSDILDTTDFEELKDNAFLLNSIRGEKAAVSKEHVLAPPSPTLLKLVKLRFALSADAKKQHFKTIQGFSEKVVADLAQTSSMSAREQLGILLTTVLERDQIVSAKTKKRATAVLDDLRDDESVLSKTLEGVPALKYLS